MGTLKFFLIFGAGTALPAVAPAVAPSVAPSAARAAPAGAAAPANQAKERGPSARAQAALEADAAKKLKLKFDEADQDKSGTLTQEEARRAGFGFVAVHFALIDTARRGSVNFDEVMRFMQHMRKQTAAKQA